MAVAKPTSDQHPLHAAFAAAMETLLPAPHPKHLAIAVSGGRDSMAMALLTKAWADQHHIQLTALTVDHALREESANEAAQVAVWMDALNVPHASLRWEHDAITKNVQAQAREARYQLMHDWCHQHSVQHLLLAHHQDDQAETFLINLARGSGVDGLSAMAPATTRDGLTLLRPLLNTPRQQMEGLLQHAKQSWLEDSSNTNEDFTRIRFRHAMETLTELGLDTSTLANTATSMGRARDALEAQAETAMADCVTILPLGYAQINRLAWQALPEEIGLRVVSALLSWMSGATYKPRLHELQTIADMCRETKHFTPARTLQGCLFRAIGRETVRLEREFRAMEPAKPLVQETCWDHRFHFTTSQAGDARIGALGAYGLSQLEQAIRSRLTLPCPRPVAHTVPAIWSSNLEILLAAPHIHEWKHETCPHDISHSLAKPLVCRK